MCAVDNLWCVTCGLRPWIAKGQENGLLGGPGCGERRGSSGDLFLLSKGLGKGGGLGNASKEVCLRTKREQLENN